MSATKFSDRTLAEKARSTSALAELCKQLAALPQFAERRLPESAALAFIDAVLVRVARHARTARDKPQFRRWHECSIAAHWPAESVALLAKVVNECRVVSPGVVHDARLAADSTEQTLLLSWERV